MRPFLLIALVALACGREPPADAQSPYVSQLSGPVGGLSAGEVEDLLAGRGAGFARSAELNGYPGPRHALDMAEHLSLDAGQRTRIAAIFGAMQADAKRLGREIVDRERALADAFSRHAISEADLRVRVDTLAVLYGRLRGRHLVAHVETTALLTPEQIARYGEMRGYGGNTTHVH